MDFSAQERITRLELENERLKDYAERVTRELRRYHKTRPAPPPGPDDSAPLPPWATDMQMMSPLLVAQEERIAELEAVIERSVSLSEQVQLLAQENDSLRAELQKRTEQLLNVQRLAPLRDPRRDADGDELDEVQELYRLSVEQNEALAQQNQLLKVQVERMQQSLVVGQQQAQEVQSRAGQLSRVYVAEQEKSEVLARQRGAAEQRLTEVTAKLAEEVRARERLQAQVDKLEQEMRMETQNFDMQKRSLEDRCAMAQEEEERLTNECTVISQSERASRQRVLELERLLAEANQRLLNARTEAEHTRQELGQMVRDMESTQKSLFDIRQRYEQVQAKLQEREGQVGSLLLEKDRLAVGEAALRRQAGRQEDRSHAEVEALRQQRDLELSTLRGAHQRAVADLEDQLRRSEQSLAELQAQAELSERQKTWEVSALERRAAGLGAERERLNADLDESQQVRRRVERHVDSVQQEVCRLQAELRATATEAREFAARESMELAGLRSRYQTTEQLLGQVREEAQASSARAGLVEVDRSRLQAELLEERARASDALNAEQRRAQADRRNLERQLQSDQARARQEEHRACELLRAQEALRLRWQAEFGLEREALEMQVERLSQENRTMRQRNRDILQALGQRRAAGDEP